jgi:hypothetical protein
MSSQEKSMNPALIFVFFAVTSLAACRPEPAATATTQAPATTSAPAAAPATGTITGTIAETMNSGGYTYARLQTGSKDSWIATGELPVKIGDRISATIDMPMENFNSRTLNRDFPLIYFVTGVTRDGVIVPATAGTPALAMAGSHEPTQASVAAQVIEPIKPEPGGITIADLWAQRKALSGKAVTVRGKVVKVNNDIMGSNWIHLQDGSGAAKDGTNDLVVTTSAMVKVGDIVTVSGKLATDRNFGSGYAYDAIVENATVITSKAAND